MRAYHPDHDRCNSLAHAMPITTRVIAIGGGGFTHEVDPAMEDFILAQVRAERPRIGFIGTASQDDPVKIARFHRRFGVVCAVTTHLWRALRGVTCPMALPSTTGSRC